MTTRADHPRVEILAAYIDATLSMTERQRVEDHLATCPQCVQILADTARTLRYLSEHAPLADRQAAQEAAERRIHRAERVAFGLAVLAVIVVVVAFSYWQLRHG